VTSGAVGVGYEGRQIDEFVAGLRSAGVGIVVDVRLTPVSRKRGFSKRSLAENLAAAGIRYEHLPALGNPKDNRAGFAGGPAEVKAAIGRYTERIAGDDEASAALERIVRLAATELVAVLCFEADDERCHRQVVLSLVDAP
jgi:uncharacterized protein (DUF488 family)